MSDLFGTSGVRGIANKDVTPELALDLSRSFAKEIGGSKRVLIGRDTRYSGEMLENALVAGFLSSGCDVKKLGVVPTPVVGFSIRKKKADAGVMITASHNPPEYNGIKFFDSRGMAISPEKERKIEDTYHNKDFKVSDWREIQEVGHTDVLKDYLAHSSGEISLDNEYKVVVGCANGPSSKTTPQLLRELGCEVITLNSQLDGSFPGRPPEPTEENLRDLSNFVKSSDADIGFAHDGDGDRIAAVSGEGEVIGQDKLLASVGSYSTERFGEGIVTTVDASKIVDEKVSEVGGEIVRTKVGDVSVVREMDSQGFAFGGEPSGTWIIGDIHPCPDGTLAAARILEMLDDYEGDLGQLADSMSSYPILRTKVECSKEEKPEMMETVENQALSVFEEAKNMSTVDGIRLEFEGGDWILIRPSGTEPYIRITVESEDEKQAKTLVETAKELLEK